jgi:HD-like signal output (HDOD) protein
LNRVSYRDLAMRGLDQLPPFSPVFNHLMASLAQEDVSFAELSTVIERDTVLAGNVLRLVNSALYGRRGTISSVRHALSIMGLTKLRNYVLSLSVSRLWARVQTSPSWSMVRFNQHSAAAAVLADLFVQRVPCEYSEGAFAGGLLHDIGRLMIAVSLPEEHEKIFARYCETGLSLEECEKDLLDLTHAELGATALARWSIPGALQKAIGGHHGGPGSGATSRGKSLAQMIRVANDMADNLGYSIMPIEAERALPADVIAASVGLTTGLDQLLESFESEFSSLRNSL